MGCTPSEPFSRRLSGIAATPARSKMWRPCCKMLVRCCCGAAISLANGLRRRPVKINLHTIRATNTIIDRIGGAIEIAPWRKWTAARVRFGPIPTKSHTVSRVVSAAASARLAACDRMNHQDFVLLARDFLDAFTGFHVKRLCSGFRFILRNHSVHFFHVSGCRIVLEKRRIAVRGKCQNLGVHVWSPVEYSFWLPAEKRLGSFGSCCSSCTVFPSCQDGIRNAL